MEWRDRVVAITGAGGFIGSHLTGRLLALGARVRAMTHGDPQIRCANLRHLTAFPNLELSGGDLRDASCTRKLILGTDTVFHLGAVTSVAYSYAHPEETIAVNALGTLNVCTAAREAGVRRLVHTSTAGVYGDARGGEPIDETHAVSGCNPYTAGKLAGDFTAQTFHLSYGLPVATARLFNTYGPRMGRYLIMPTIISQLLKGPELRLGDLRPVRPFTYIDDIVEALLGIAAADAAVGEVIHFGAEESISMSDLVTMVGRLMQREVNLIVDPSRMRPSGSEIFHVYVNAAKARRVLGWTATTPLEEGLRRTIDWFAGTLGNPE